MANSYLYPRKQKKFKKTKITLSIIAILVIVLAAFYFYKTKIKNEVMVIQSPVIFTSQSVENQENQSTTFEKVALEVSNRQVIENKTAAANNVALVYDVKVTNNGKEAITFSDTDFSLVQDGTQYTGKMDSFADIQTFNEEAIKPNSTLSRSVVFSVSPEVAEKTNFDLMIANDSWGNKQATIKLSK